MTKVDNEKPWKELQIELLEKSMKHLYLGDCIRFHLTCKSWTPITLSLRPIHQLKFPDYESGYGFENFKLPWLISFPRNNNKGLCKLFHPIYNDAYLMDVTELAGSFILHSKGDRLIMSKDFAGISFTSLPTSPDCIVFAHGDSALQSRVFSIVWVIMEMLVYNPDMETWDVVPNLLGHKCSIYSWFMAECDGEMTSVFVGRYHSFGSYSNSSQQKNWYDMYEHKNCTWMELNVDTPEGILGTLDPVKTHSLMNVKISKYVKRQLLTSFPNSSLQLRSSTSVALVFPHGRRERNQTFFNLSDGKYTVKKIPEMKDNVKVKSFYVFKLDFSKMVWVKVDSLGNQVMLLDELKRT
ncbi:hypothetical protein GIB67_006173 [Kingdonia uniflora]|uniref:KIB1-4 beta-propeller domain-containing protein n=1 Tax=Kingdonia uniflora TaxID=39325 RepID=A0A7J7LPU2_9MAGN|nr:hypothetical protein GIB67_006173 [Kingdonia uniflora]